MIKLVYFDFGGVLTESGKRGFISNTIADLYGLPHGTIDITDLHHILRRGKASETMFFKELNKRFKGHITKEMFLARVHASFTPSPQVYDLATRLRARGIRTGILSNVFAMNARELEKQGSYDEFDPVVLSCDEGFAKPEVELYRIAIARAGVDPQEILFIDDQKMCMPPAKKMGMHTLLAVSPGQIVKDTERIIAEQNNQKL